MVNLKAMHDDFKLFHFTFNVGILEKQYDWILKKKVVEHSLNETGDVKLLFK